MATSTSLISHYLYWFKEHLAVNKLGNLTVIGSIFWMLLLAPWLVCAEGMPVVLATPEFPPHFSEQSAGQGYYSEIVREALARAGYSLDVKFAPFERAIQMAEHNDINGILGALLTAERQNKFYYSDPVVDVELSLFGRADEPVSFDSLHDLRGYKIGVMRGASISEAFDHADYLDKQEVTSQLQNLSKLISKRIDLFACEKQHVAHLIEQHHPEWQDQVTALVPALDVRSVHIMLSKDNPAHQTIIEHFNLQLAAMRADGTYQHIASNHRSELSPELLQALGCKH
ncbi:transporter substrate-binding domain-containing protein [Neiella marina]|uniref:Transporter substrate-binding domain-containing protein n=1 Tax=Neiella holothuriorum TaxID=2870530 RepID=A0ABS7EJX1_9GAMM|nr:transporter substrate-binding domain-containing protein [Neiella holothuriorum]MBW8192524.1 transporter substrate-binding domain-containing protein [Neiella holothuriorum]